MFISFTAHVCNLYGEKAFLNLLFLVAWSQFSLTTGDQVL